MLENLEPTHCPPALITEAVFANNHYDDGLSHQTLRITYVPDEYLSPDFSHTAAVARFSVN